MFAEGSAINYSCLSGYEPHGTGIFICLKGHWQGLFNCTIRKCPSLKSPDHGMMYNTCREVACVVKFFCNAGYQRVGSESSYCRENGSWSNTVPECHIMKCPLPPILEHGYLLNLTGGLFYVFGTEMSVKCNEGFIRSGPSRIYCASNGQWTLAPACLPSKCSSYPGLDGKCVETTKVQSLRDDGFLLFIYCTENATFIKMNDDAATCSNGRWSNLSMRCYCDCQVNVISEGVLSENLSLGTLLKHGETRKWSCQDGYTNATSDLLACYDGVIDQPKCLSRIISNGENSIGSGKVAKVVVVATTCTAGVGLLILIIITVYCLKHKYFKCKCFKLKGNGEESSDMLNEDSVETELNTSLVPLDETTHSTTDREMLYNGNQTETEAKKHKATTNLDETDRINQDEIQKADENIEILTVNLANAKFAREKMQAEPNRRGVIGPLGSTKVSKFFRRQFLAWDQRKKRSHNGKDKMKIDNVDVESTTECKERTVEEMVKLYEEKQGLKK